MLAAINGTDISKCINDSTYKVYSEDVYEEWIDANHTTHRSIIRDRVVGSFDLAFAGSLTMDLDSFKALLDSRSSSGTISLTVFVQNKNETETVTAFYTMESTKYADVGNGTKVQIFSFEFEEA